MFPTERPRRLRSDGVRDLVRETNLHASDLIAPVFVDATTDDPVDIPSLPGHERVPPDGAVERALELVELGVGGILLFGIPNEKDERGSRAWATDGVVQNATQAITNATDATVITDVCLCEYTSHGHCGVLEPDARTDPHQTVDNDQTLDLLGRIAVSHVRAGADLVAPSAMMDGQVGAIRAALDDAGFPAAPILSYAVKYASSFYGPFRDAADGAPAFGNRRHYQMDPTNAKEAVRELSLDVDEGADIVMVKPALPYLDIVSRVAELSHRPVFAYNVSGEYAMLHAAADRGWLNLEATALESLTAIKRAGAGRIVTYFAEDLAERL